MHKWGGPNAFPNVITVFSAPNYCGTYNNRAAVLCLEDNNLQIKQFSAVDAPYSLPDNLDLFSWSLPFVAEKVNKLMVHIITQCTPAELQRLADHPTLLKELDVMSDDARAKIKR